MNNFEISIHYKRSKVCNLHKPFVINKFENDIGKTRIKKSGIAHIFESIQQVQPGIKTHKRIPDLAAG